METDLDFEFEFERATVHLDVKEKLRPLSDDYADYWPEVPRTELFILDEVAFRKLVWDEGMGYLLVHDGPNRRWAIFGPWELCLGPRRRLERPGDRGAGEFLKGKLLVDLRAAAITTDLLDVDALLEVVRRSRAALTKVRSVPIRTEGEVPVIPSLRPAFGPDRRPDRGRPPAPATAPPAADPTWSGLSPELVAALAARWGWRAPTPVQAAAFPGVLAGQNLLILAPTAGGKTEAALLPLLDLLRREGWRRGPSILAINPLRALLDDQLTRWRRAGALVGATAFAWHGDVSSDERRAFKDDPADALLTTPESLENLLTSASHDEHRLFDALQAVVVDEVHAFVGTPRGAQLASLLERLDRFVGPDLQRIGLSATVGNPSEVLDWLRGGSLREHRVVSDGSPVQGEHVDIRTYGDAAEAIAVIGEAAAGERSLVFARSRKRAEELASGLGVAVHHSSVAAGRRASALADLASGRADCVVATAGLEMGIDVADLGLVIHDGAPSSPGSYLQRLGRAGRRTQQRRLVFTTGEADDLLLILGVLARVRRHDIDALPPRRGARLVLGQQALAVAFQTFISDRHGLADTLLWSPVFAGLAADVEATIAHLLKHRWLRSDGERLVAGPEAQRRFGGPRGVAALLATFGCPEQARVVTEDGVAVGEVDWDRIDAHDTAGAAKDFTLAGRSWTVGLVDRGEGIVVVAPGGRSKPLSWRGPSLEVSRRTWEAVREVLAGTEVPVLMDHRATAWLERERLIWQERLRAPVQELEGATVIDSFAGVGAHQAVLTALELEGLPGGPTLDVRASRTEVGHRSTVLLDDLDTVLDAEARRQTATLPLRFPELTSPTVILAEAREFHVDADGIRRCLTLAAEGTWPS